MAYGTKEFDFRSATNGCEKAQSAHNAQDLAVWLHG